jgi:hypothetical protein
LWKWAIKAVILVPEVNKKKANETSDILRGMFCKC